MSKSTVNTNSSSPSAIAIGSHPDDIEFMMAGTLLLLKEAGSQIHYLNLSIGNCGSQKFTAWVPAQGVVMIKISNR